MSRGTVVEPAVVGVVEGAGLGVDEPAGGGIVHVGLVRELRVAALGVPRQLLGTSNGASAPG